MRALFEQIEREGFVAIEQAVAERQQENVGLDFKEKSDASNGRLTRDDRQMLAENLSAFANSAGGLLVLGVEARKDADGVDAAAAVRPIKELARLQTEVTHAAGELLLPRHDGILVVPVPTPGEPDSGCLAIWVERSERRPHQSQAARDRRYYKRAGDSTFVMEHYDIEDAFRRLVTPELKLEQSLQAGPVTSGPEGRLATHMLVLSLRNDSTVSAKFPYLHARDMRGVALSRLAAEAYPLHYRRQLNVECFDGGANSIINPGQALVVVPLELLIWTIGSTHYLAEGSQINMRDMKRTPLGEARISFRCSFGSENCPMQTVEREFTDIGRLVGI
jgi:hypothetical protein